MREKKKRGFCLKVDKPIQVKEDDKKEKKEQSEEIQEMTEEKKRTFMFKPKESATNGDEEEEDNEEKEAIDNIAKNLNETITNDNILSNGKKITDSLSGSDKDREQFK